MDHIFEITGTLPEDAIRHIVREAAGSPAGTEPKALLVKCAMEHLASDLATGHLLPIVQEAFDNAEMMGQSIADRGLSIKQAAAGLVKQGGAVADAALFEDIDAAAMAYRVALAAVRAKPVLPMNAAKWLAKLGIVKAHIDALTAGDVPPTDATPIEDPEPVASVAQLFAPPSAPELQIVVNGDVIPLHSEEGQITVEAAGEDHITDPDMREMLGLPPLGAVAVTPATEVVPADPLPVSSAAGADAPAQTPSSAAPSAAPADAPPPPEPADVRGAFSLVRQGTDLDDAKLAERLAMSRSTLHNYLSGRTQKVKCTHEQAKVMVADIDLRVSMLRKAADIFAQVRP